MAIDESVKLSPKLERAWILVNEYMESHPGVTKRAAASAVGVNPQDYYLAQGKIRGKSPIAVDR